MGAAFCWGHSFSGQLGDGNAPTNSARPVAVLGGLVFDVLSAGGDFQYHTCGVTAGGDAHCWGEDFFGRLGNSFEAGSSDVPVRVALP